MDVRSRQRTNPRSIRFVLGKAREYRRRPGGNHVDPLSRRREVAHGVLCSSPKPEQTILFRLGAARRGGMEIFCRLFSTHQPTTHLRSRYRINPRSTRFVSGKASEYRWRPPKVHVGPWSRGREVARDVLRFLPKPEKMSIFCHRRWIEISVICFLYTSGQMFSQTGAAYHRPSCE